jgi:signal transduction histidine kinase
LSFRAKLLLVLFVPFLALVVVGAAGLSDRFSALAAQRQYGDLSVPLRSLNQASRAIENESVVSSWSVAGGGTAAAELIDARARTDAAVRQFRAGEQAFADAGLSTDAVALLGTTNRGLAGIPRERGRVDALTTDAAGTRTFFLGVDDDLLAFGERVSRDVADPDTAGSLTRTFALERAQHELAREASVYVAVLASGKAQDFSEWVSAQGAVTRYRAQFTNTASPQELEAYQHVVGTAAPSSTLPASFPVTAPTPAVYHADYQRQANQLDQAISAVNGVVRDASTSSASAALLDTRVYGGAAVFAMLLTLLLIWFVSRAVVGPVRRLTAAAREMSQRQLPALVESLRTGGDVSALKPTRIDVTSEDEIGELAQAFNDVEAVTMEVAQEQSRLLRKGMGDLFVNLARRNQSLLERQLELLDDLERNEHDPTALDSLFKLDHMATRMRRNAESLLVLSGAEQPRQWQQPIGLLDVVRAAAAEIADFPRVELVGIEDDVAVAGRAVADVAHLLAELLENATLFSPPDSAVVVSGATTASGFVLAVSDQGIGMPADRIAAANQLLAKPPLVGLALSRALGLHVVASLAARHLITVELRPGAPVGLVALVTLPQSVLEPRPTPEAPRPATAPAASVPPAPVYAPDVNGDGAPAPLGARRVVWRPADEPPVEEWRREGLEDVGSSAPPTGPAAPPVSQAPPVGDDLFAREPVAPAAPAGDPTGDPAGVFTGNFAGNSTGAAFEESFQEPFDDQLDDQLNDQIPLAARVPGQHLSHQPVAEALGEADDADPLRPYRVHELLTRHAQGKRRGRAEVDGDPVGPPADGPSLEDKR